MTDWTPLFYEDYAFKKDVDILDVIRRRVVDYNESFDFKITGKRGKGKSTVALSLGLRLDPNFSVSKNVGFTAEEWLEKAAHLKRGAAFVADEMGTRKSGSSHKWMSQENQELSDDTQLNRTDGVIFIATTPDQMRITNRVRDLFSVDVYPERKLKIPRFDAAGNLDHYDLAIRCILRITQEDPFGQNGGNDFLVYPRYAPHGVIKRVILYHPPEDVYNEYAKGRQHLLDELRETAKFRREQKEEKAARLLAASKGESSGSDLDEILRHKLLR